MPFRLTLPLAFALALSAFAALPASAVETPAGPIWNNFDAQRKCPDVCRQSGGARWNGNWRTLPGTATSVCDCDAPAPAPGRAPGGGTQWAEAGPLWSQMDAQNKCPDVCSRSGGRSWDGNWRTTEPGRMSVCSCQSAGAPAAPGAGPACKARARGGCAGCSVQCRPGERASCSEGSTWNDRLGNGDTGCVGAAQCTCS